jgi:hypothetical protein
VRRDPRLDRREQFDERSRAFPIRALVPTKPRSYTWRCCVTLDQGREGACVGFAWAHEVSARPLELRQETSDALWFYREAQKVDEWPGENYSGTSVLAGAKVVQREGFLTEYRWAFGLQDLVLALGYKGPAVLGIPWYEGMYEPDPKGIIRPTGRVAGGHAILANGVNVKRELVRLHNSWGPDYGLGGSAFISFGDLERLLHEDGEACIPVVRTRGKG